MAIETLEVDEPGLPWYSKVFDYLKNRNKIGPGRVELPDCDFFIVGPRRTIRILRPSPKSSGFYELNDHCETINENFISRWAKRPHSSSNCRCSFRQSSRLSTNEERMITAEINRIRTSLCEAEKTGQNIEEIEQRISVNLNGLTTPITGQPRSHVDVKLADIANVGPSVGIRDADDLAIKNKIVRDLEKYIDVLLEEVLNDTIKFISDADHTLKKSRSVLKTEKSEIKKEALFKKNQDIESSTSSLEISFAFPADEIDACQINVENHLNTKGYVNQAFQGTTADPDCLDFDLRNPIDSEEEKIDCVDSGINSVETVEFQPEPEISLEQSLMEIIDAKFGRGPVKNWNDLTQENTVNHRVEKSENRDPEISIKKEIKLVNSGDRETNTDHESRRIDETTEVKCIELGLEFNLEPSLVENQFENSKLEFKDDNKIFSMNDEPLKKPNVVAVFCEKFTSKLGAGCSGRENKIKDESDEIKSMHELAKQEKVYRKTQNNCDSHQSFKQPPRELVVLRKSRKPVIVFIHGFGSSADVFQPQLDYFSKMGYPCIAPEMIGHGMSSAPSRSREYHFDKLFNDLEVVLHHYAFRTGQKCVLVAHNYGCSFATALACKYEHEIHQLVLISGGGPTPLAPPSREGPGHCCLRATLSPLLMCGLHRDILYSARGRQHPYCGIEPEDQWPSHMHYVLEGMIWPEGDYVYHRRICTPTLLIHGLRDNKVSLVQECQMERTIIKAFLEAIPSAGHMPMTDCPDQVNHMIHCFIDLWTKKKR